MKDENNYQDSYFSLSAFLCLQSKNNYQQVNLSQSEIKFKENENNSILINKSNPYYRSDEQSKEQQSDSNSKTGKQKRQKKEYSKNYRRRHKEFVESLKSMNDKYEIRIEQLTLKIDQMAEQIKCLKYGRQINDSLFDSTFMKEKQQTLKQLVNQSQNKKQASWQKVRQFARCYGFAGKEKINLLNYYMSQIMGNLLIDHHKNFVLNGLQDFQITKNYAQTLHQKEQQIVGFSNSDFSLLKKYLKRWMPQHLKKFHKIGQDFYQCYVKLINQVKQIQNRFSSLQDGVYKLLPANKYICVLKWYEENKYCKQIQLVRKEWFQSFRKN